MLQQNVRKLTIKPNHGIGIPLLTQTRARQSSGCFGDFGEWMIGAVNGLWRHMCTGIDALESCDTANMLVASCRSEGDEQPETFFGRRPYEFGGFNCVGSSCPGKLRFVESLQSITTRPIVVRNGSDFYTDMYATHTHTHARFGV